MTQDHFEAQRAPATGATSGIGRAVALELARDGAEVLVHGRDAARGTETVAEIAAADGKARFVVADLREPTDVERLAREVGDVDILINNAGTSRFGRPQSSTCPRSRPCSPARQGAVLPGRRD